MRTWKVLEDKENRNGEMVPLECQCGTDALVPTRGNAGSPIIAIKGLSIIFSNPDNVPPDGWLPPVIQCRVCGRIYSSGDK